MNRSHFATWIFATALVSSPALAQTTTPPGGAMQPPAGTVQQQPGATMQPGTSTAAPPAATGATAGQMGSMRPLASPGPGQMLSSKLRGTDVYGANNENIGDINDVLIDRSGRVVAVLVGVGGFLGIGQKDVAIPFQALEIVPERAAATTTGTAAGAGTVTPDRIVLRGLTRADLEAAPNFRADGTGTGTGAAGTTGAGGRTGTNGATR